MPRIKNDADNVYQTSSTSQISTVASDFEETGRKMKKEFEKLGTNINRLATEFTENMNERFLTFSSIFASNKNDINSLREANYDLTKKNKDLEYLVKLYEERDSVFQKKLYDEMTENNKLKNDIVNYEDNIKHLRIGIICLICLVIILIAIVLIIL